MHKFKISAAGCATAHTYAYNVRVGLTNQVAAKWRNCETLPIVLDIMRAFPVTPVPVAPLMPRGYTRNGWTRLF